MSTFTNDETFSVASSLDEMDDYGLFNDTGFFETTDHGAGGDGDLPNLLLDQLQTVRTDAIKNIAASVRIRQSFRKRSSVASLIPGSRDSSTPGPARNSGEFTDFGDLRQEESQVLHLTPSTGRESGNTRSRRKLTQLVEAWVSSSNSAENGNRVRQMKEILVNNPVIANEFLSDGDTVMSLLCSKQGTPEGQALDVPARGSIGSDPGDAESPECKPPRQTAIVYGGAYRMLEDVLLLRRDATADSRAAQAFEVLYAAATVATDWPMPLPAVTTEVLDAVLGSDWRPPLTSFLALRLIIALSPQDALGYCRTVLTNCLHFQFRVVDAAMVCVAEEAVDGTSNLTSPGTWVAPVLAVIRFVTSTAMSTELLILAVDILNFTISCGCSSVFVEEGGVSALAEALLVVEAMPEHREVVIRVLKLLNPQTLLKPPERKFETSVQREAGELGNPLMSGQYVAFMEEEEEVFHPPVIKAEHCSQIVAATLSVFDRFSALCEAPHAANDTHATSPAKRPSLSPTTNALPCFDDEGHFVEVCGVMLFAVMRQSFATCSEEGAIEAFCGTIARVPKYWSNRIVMRSALSIIQSYLSMYHAYQREKAVGAGGASPPRDILADQSVVHNVSAFQSQMPHYKLTTLSTATTSSSASPNFYRPIMDPGILAALSVSLRCFYLEPVGSNTIMANVYRVIHLACLTEPAKRCFLRGCNEESVEENDDDDSQASSDGPAYPEANALIPCLLYCLSRTTQLDHQRYCTAILSRMCRGSPKEFCGQLLGPLPPGTLQMAAVFQKGSKHSVVSIGGQHTATSPSVKVVPTEEPPTPVGAVCRFFAKRLGIWNPELIPVVLGLMREVARYFTFPYSRPSFHRGGCEALFASIQSCVMSFSTDPNIVASGSVVLGLLCRCPHTYNPANLNSAASAMYLNRLRGPFQEEVSTSFAASARGRQNSTGEHVPTQSLLRYALEHDAVDLLVSLSHGQFAEARPKRTDGGEGHPHRHERESPSTVLTPLDSTVGPPPPTTEEDGEALVLSEKLPVLVKVGLALLSASLAQDEDVITTLHEEGLVAVMQYVCDLYSNHLGGAAKPQIESGSPRGENVGGSDQSPEHPVEGATASDSSPRGGRRHNVGPTLLSREDREFVRKQLVAIRQFDAKLRNEEKKLEEEELRAKQPSDEASAHHHGRTEASAGASADSALLEAFWLKQRALLYTEFEHRRLAEVEDELYQREALKISFLSRMVDLRGKEARDQLQWKQERVDFEGRFLESRKHIEQFQSDNFMELVSYSHRSLQKKLTAAVRFGHRLSVVSPQAPSLHRSVSDANRYTGRSDFGDTMFSVLDESTNMSIAMPEHPLRLSPASANATARQPSSRDSRDDTSRAPTSAERDALSQLDLLRLELGIQNSTGLASIMQTITATLAAVKQLQRQQEAMTRELSAPPTEYTGSRLGFRNESSADYPRHERSATPRGRQPVLPSRPMSAPDQRSVRRQTSRPPSGTAGTGGMPKSHQEDDIYEDRSPSPLDRESTRPIPATPPPRTRPTSASTFRLQYSKHAPADALAVCRDPSEAAVGVSIRPQGSVASIAAELEALIAGGTLVSVLDLNYSYLGDSGVLQLVPTISKLVGLRELHLQRNGISADSLVPLLADAVAPQQTLRVLDLSFNRDITPRCGRDLLAFIKAVPSVVQVNVEGTQLFVSTKRIVESVLAERRLGGLETSAEHLL